MPPPVTAAATIVLVGIVAAACATSGDGSGGPAAETNAGEDTKSDLTVAAATSGSGGATTAQGAGGAGGTGMMCAPNEAKCGGICIDVMSDPLNCGDCGTECDSAQTCSDGQCTTGSMSSSGPSSSATTTSSTSSSSSSGGGGGTCHPLSPATACGPGHHCRPQPSGVPTCEAPTGSGTQYAGCSNNTHCAPGYECTNNGYAQYCLQWCTNDFDCPNFFDSCYGLTPATYVGSQAWGVCWDGLP